jgi:hypothetical protein
MEANENPTAEKQSAAQEKPHRGRLFFVLIGGIYLVRLGLVALYKQGMIEQKLFAMLAIAVAAAFWFLVIRLGWYSSVSFLPTIFKAIKSWIQTNFKTRKNNPAE